MHEGGLMQAKKIPALKTIFLILIAIILSACAGGNSQNGFSDGNFPLGVAPDFLIDTATEGNLRAELTVYGPNGELVHSEDLQINVETGEIFSSQFELPRGFTYTFIITFYFSKSGLAELPVAFVAKVASTEEQFLNVFFEASEVLTALAQLNPDISTSLSSSNIPDLDADDDGFSNFAEVLEGSDPYDPNDIPQAPQQEGPANIISRDNIIELKVIFTDTSGIASIKPTGDFNCGYFEWNITPLDAEGKRTELHAKFNLYSKVGLTDGQNINLSITVSDKLGINATHSIPVDNIGISSIIPNELNHAEILTLSPKNNETVSDFFIVEAMACHRNGVNAFFVENLDGFNDEDATLESILGPMSTANLNANQQIKFTAVASGGFPNSKSITIHVDDANPIKIDSPTPGTTLTDGFTVVAHVDKNLMPDITQFFIEKVTSDIEGNDDIFALNQLKFDVNSLPEAFTGQVFDSSDVQALQLYVHFVAIGPNTGRKERVVAYLLDNLPQILEFDVLRNGPHACIRSGNIHLKWRVDNIGEDGEVWVDGKQVLGDLRFNGDTTGFAQEVLCQGIVDLEAIRFAQDLSGGPDQAISATESLPLDQFKINPVNGANIFRTLNTTIFQINLDAGPGNIVDPNNLSWRITIEDHTTVPSTLTIKTDTDIPDMANINGSTLGLHLWGDYTITFEIMANGEAISTSAPFDITYAHPDVVGWWGLDQDFSPYFDLTPNSHDAFVASGNPMELNSGCILAGCLGFDGNDGLFVLNSTLLNPSSGGSPESFTVEAWVSWGGTITNNPIIEKDGQFLIGVSAGKLEFTVIDQATIHHTAGISVGGIGNPNNWHHITGVYSNGEKPELWVDGIKVNDPTATTPTTIQNISGDLIFGADSPLLKFFSGTLDDIKFYNTNLTQTQIRNSCNFMSPGTCPAP